MSNKLVKATKSFINEFRSTPSVGFGLSAFVAWAMNSDSGGPTASGETVNLNSSLQCITVYACVRVLTNGVSSLPCQLFTKQGNSRIQQHSPLASLLGISPNDEMSAVTFWSSVVGSMALAGNAYAEIQRNGAGQVVALWPLNPNETRPKRDSQTNALFYETTDGCNTPRRIESLNMFHVPLFSFDGVMGLSPIASARQGIGLARAAELFGARLFGNGSKAGGILSPPANISPEAMAAAKTSWNESQSGSKQGSTAVLPGDWKYTPLAINPNDSQFLETRNFQRTEIAALFGVPSSMIGSEAKQSKASAEQEAISFLTDTLRPYLSRIEAEIQRKLIGDAKQFAEFNVSERLRTDFKTSMDGFAVARQWGFYNANMVLEQMGQNPIGPVGDIFWAPVNMQNAERLLDTESIQDQPINANPALPAPEVKALGKYTVAFIQGFSDGYRRLANRDKRSIETVKQVLGPTLSGIAQLSLSDALEKCSYDKVSDEIDVSSIIHSTCQSILKRMDGLKDDPTDAEIDIAANNEFRKTLRSIYITTQKEISGFIADQEMQEDAANEQ